MSPGLSLPLFVQFEMALMMAPVLITVWSALRRFDEGVYVGLLGCLGSLFYLVSTHAWGLTPSTAASSFGLICCMLMATGFWLARPLLLRVGIILIFITAGTMFLGSLVLDLPH